MFDPFGPGCTFKLIIFLQSFFELLTSTPPASVAPIGPRRAAVKMATNIDTKELVEKDEYSDVIIKSGDEEVKCHRLVLCIRSKYFRTILKLDSGFIVNERYPNT